MRPRFVGRLGAADLITLGNAVLGFLATAVALSDPHLAARLVLLAGVADGLDGVVARRLGGTPVGEHLDSLSDVASFGVAPAVLVAAVAFAGWGVAPGDLALPALAALAVPAGFLAAVVVRLGLYAAYDTTAAYTQGVPSTLAATILATAVLTRTVRPALLLAGAVLLAYLMVTRIAYPDLLARDAVLMGVVHVLAAVAPDALGRAFPYALLTLAAAYLVLAPRFYWRAAPDGAQSLDAGTAQ